MLIRMGIPYNCPEAGKTGGEEVMGFIQREGKNASAALAEERGVFPSYEGASMTGDEAEERTVTTIAPHGNPLHNRRMLIRHRALFAVSYVRTVMEAQSSLR